MKSEDEESKEASRRQPIGVIPCQDDDMNQNSQPINQEEQGDEQIIQPPTISKKSSLLIDVGRYCSILERDQDNQLEVINFQNLQDLELYRTNLLNQINNFINKPPDQSEYLSSFG